MFDPTNNEISEDLSYGVIDFCLKSFIISFFVFSQCAVLHCIDLPNMDEAILLLKLFQ